MWGREQRGAVVDPQQRVERETAMPALKLELMCRSYVPQDKEAVINLRIKKIVAIPRAVMPVVFGVSIRIGHLY